MRRYLIIFLILIGSLHLNSITKSQSPQAIIYDPLSPEQNVCSFEELLIEAGYDVTLYKDKEADVNSFKHISIETTLIIFRVHSSINNEKIWVFTGEHYSEEKHSIDQLTGKIHRAKTNQHGEYQYALGSSFFHEYLPELDGTKVLILGCDAATSEDLSNIFLEKGASSVIGWDGPVSIEHTDVVFTKILELMIKGLSAEKAAEQAITEHGPDPYFKSCLICFK